MSKQVLQPVIARDVKTIKAQFKEINQIVTKKYSEKIDELKILELISEGTCSKLFKVYDKIKDRVLYLKVIEVKDEQDNVDAYNEMNIYLSLIKQEDPLLLQVLAAEVKSEKDDKDHKFYLLLEGGKGSLKDISEFRLSKGVTWNEAEIFNVLRELVIQVHKLYELNIVCRDVRPENLILTTSGIKILDYSQACPIPFDTVKLDLAGTPWYMAPELVEANRQMHRRTEYNPVATESYSIGMTILKMLSPNISDKEQLLNILEKDAKRVYGHVKEMIQDDETKRKTFLQLYASLGLAEVAKEMVKANNTDSNDPLKEELNIYIKVVPKNIKPSDYLAFLGAYYSLEQYHEFNAVLEELKLDGPKYQSLKAREKVKFHEILAKSALNVSDERRALENFLKVLEYQTLAYGPNHAHIATTYTTIGRIYLKLEEYEKAIENYKNALEVRKNVGMIADNARGVLLFELGSCYERTGEVGKASECYQMALDTFEALHGPGHTTVASAYNFLGTTLEVRGDYKEALNCFKKSLDIRLALYQDTHPSVAVSYNNMGLAYEKLGEYKRAREVYQKALEIWTKHFGTENEKVATALNNIGSTYDNLKDYKMAKEYYTKSLDLRLKLFGEDHRSVAQSYNNIGTVFYFAKDYDKAIENYNKALRIWTNIMGENNVKVATVYNNLATVFRIQGKNDPSKNEEAKKYFEKCLNIKLGIYGKNHPSVAITFTNLAETHYATNDKTKALELFRTAYEIRLSQLGKNHPETKESETILFKMERSMKP